MIERKKKILAVASGGGHWVQLLRVVPACEGHDVAYVTVDRAYREDIETPGRFYKVVDATLWHKLKLLVLALQMFWVVLRERPDVVLSTGAAPGYFALMFGKLIGSRTIWIDSIANAERLSKSGQHVGRFADLWLTQWPHMAQPDGPRYEGAVI